MPGVPPGPSQLFDILLMGLTWLRRDKPEHLARTGASIFGAMQAGGVISEPQRRSLSSHTKLISLAMPQCDILKGRCRPSRTVMLDRIVTSDKLIIVLVTPAEAFQYDRLFGPQGYRLVVTDAGMKWANQVAAQYELLTNPDKFIAETWPLFRFRTIGARRHQMEAGRAAVNRTGVQDIGGPRERPAVLTGAIPRASHDERDYMWGDE